MPTVPLPTACRGGGPQFQYDYFVVSWPEKQAKGIYLGGETAQPVCLYTVSVWTVCQEEEEAPEGEEEAEGEGGAEDGPARCLHRRHWW